jgi:hypothetical protein
MGISPRAALSFICFRPAHLWLSGSRCSEQKLPLQYLQMNGNSVPRDLPQYWQILPELT